MSVRRKKQIQSTNWCFTLNNYTEAEVILIGNIVHKEKPFSSSTSVIRSLACSEEVAPRSGTPHLQGYLQCSKKVSLAALKQVKGIRRAHFSAMRGTFTENEKYCSKEGTLTHFGVPFVGRGARTDRNEVYAQLKSGADDQVLMEADFAAYCRFRNGISDYRSYQRPVRQDPVEIYLFFGEPGAGKTEFAIQQLGPDYYRLPVSDSFWLTPACSGKKFILIDEFRANMKLNLLLQVLDKYPIEVAKKGGFVWWCPHVIIITTNKSPWTWYDYNARDMEREALFRRFTGVYRFRKNAARVPTPVEINIESPADFAYPAVPVAVQGNRFMGEGMF